MDYRINRQTGDGICTVSEVKISYRPEVRPSERPEITCPEDMYRRLRENGLFALDAIEHREFFKVLLLNRAGRLLGISHLSEGGIHEAVVDIRHIMQAAILSNASQIVLCHNHPSGNLQPSVQDDRLTKRVKEACDIFDISLTDHLVVSSESYYSYADEGRIL